MTFTTITYDGTEKSLADWKISSCKRVCSNQAGDNVAFDMQIAADAADPFPYGALIILQIGRTTTAVNPVNATLPPSGATYSGGTVWFIGYRVKNLRNLAPQMEKMAFKFAGMWEFFFDRIKFKKLFVTYNGVNQVTAYRGQIVLGESLVPLYGAGDTVTGSAATNLMSIRQQIIEIVQYAVMVTNLQYGTPQFQFDDLTSVIDSTNYDLLDSTIEEMVTDGLSCLIPDYLPNMGGPPGTAETNATANLNTVLRAPLDAVNNISCGEALRRQLAQLGIGDAVAWWDYSTATFSDGTMTAGPTLKICTRDQLPPLTLNWPAADASQNAPNAPFTGPNGQPYWSLGGEISDRSDLVPSAVAMQYRIAGSGQPEVVNDIAMYDGDSIVEGIGLDGILQSPAQFLASDDPATTNLGGTIIDALQNAALYPAALGDTVDMEGGQSISATIVCTSVAASDPIGESAGGAEYDFWTALFPELLKTASLAFASSFTPTFVDSSGASIDLTTYKYWLRDGQVAPWMAGMSGPGETKQGTVTAAFQYQEKDATGTVTAKSVGSHTLTAPITLTNLPGGTYGETAAGEQVPYGMSGFLLAIWSILQYEGTFSFQEIEITDQCPMGNNLCVTGGLAAWETMSACVQSISYDLAEGRTEITIGPAGHLDAKDWVARNRANRGARWLYTIGGNLVNSAGGNGALGSNVPKSGASPGNAIASQQFHPTSMSDWISNPTQPSPAGVTIDGQNSTNTYGGYTAPSAPVVHLQLGSGGTVTSIAQINANGDVILKKGTLQILLRISDLPSGFATNSSGVYDLKLREVEDCVDGTTMYRQILTSEPYTTSLGNT